MSAIDLLDPDLRRQRLAALARHPSAMGIDDVEVGSATLGRVELVVAFVPGEGSGAGKPARPTGLTPRTSGSSGRTAPRPRRLRVLAVGDATDRDDAIVVTVAVDGDAARRSGRHLDPGARGGARARPLLRGRRPSGSSPSEGRPRRVPPGRIGTRRDRRCRSSTTWPATTPASAT